MRLRSELRDALDVDAELRPGWPTQFVVYADDRVVFSRRTERRLPRPGEIAELLRLHTTDNS